MASYWPLMPHVLQGVVICLLLFLDFMLTRRRNRLQLKQALDKQKMESMYPKRHVARSYRVVPCPPLACPTPLAKSAPTVFGPSVPEPPGALSLGLELDWELAGGNCTHNGSLVRMQGDHILKSPTKVESSAARASRLRQGLVAGDDNDDGAFPVLGARATAAATTTADDPYAHSVLTSSLTTEISAVQGTLRQPGPATISVPLEDQKAQEKDERETSKFAGGDQTSPVPLRKPIPDQLLKLAASKSTIHGRYPRTESGKGTQESNEAGSKVWKAFLPEISQEEQSREHRSRIKLQRSDLQESHAGPTQMTWFSAWRGLSADAPDQEQPPPPSPPPHRLITVQPSFESDSLPESDQGLLRQARIIRRKSPRQTAEKRPNHSPEPKGNGWEIRLSSPPADTCARGPPSDPASAPSATADRSGGQPVVVARRAKNVPVGVGPRADDAEGSLAKPLPPKKHKRKKRRKQLSTSNSLEKIAP